MVNDDGPTLSVNDVAVLEGNSGVRTAVFTVALSTPSPVPVTFDFATSDVSATAGSDYTGTALAGQTIPVGMVAKTFAVQVNGDTVREASENFRAQVANAVGASVFDGGAFGTITNDD